MNVTPANTTAVRTPPDAGAEVVVRCTQLSKVFRDFWMRPRAHAVKAIDMDIRRGEVFGLLGPNGSGKSTTIKMILGLLSPTSGRIAVFGKPPGDVATKNRIGYLPEESYLYRFLNARETLDYYARLFHLPHETRRRRVDQLLHQVGLEANQRRPVGEYSKGMQRRIGLAQALINDPDLLILDEPTTGLDPEGAMQIKDVIVNIARRGKTILLCSHLLADVEDVCDRVCIMYGGTIRAQGTVDELLTRQDVTNLQTETLDEQTMRQIQSLLEARGRRLVGIEHPRQKLEAFFLDNIAKARAEGMATSGATSGGEIAGFLVDRGEESDSGQRVIESLIRQQPDDTATTIAAGLAGSTPQPATQGAQSQPTPDQPKPDTQVLAGLVAASPPKAPTPPSAVADEPKPDLSVLDGLLTPGTQATAGSTPTTPVTPTLAVTTPAPPPPPSTPALNAAPSQPVKLAPAPQTPAPNTAKPDEPAELPYTPPPKPPAAKATEGGEKPDENFLKALQDVPPYKNDEEEQSKKG